MKIFQIFIFCLFFLAFSSTISAENNSEQSLKRKRTSPPSTTLDLFEKGELLNQFEGLKPIPLNKQMTIQDICCSSSIPSGWIKVNDKWDPLRCGKPTTIIYNVCTISRYDNKPIGHSMDACRGRVPTNWSIVGSRWDPISCGRPTSSAFKNVMRIRRIK